MLLRNAAYHELALLKLPLPLCADSRYVQCAGRPAPFRELKLKLPTRSFVLVHAAVIAVEQLLEHVSGLPLATHRLGVRFHRRGVVFEGSPQAALGFSRQAPTGSGQYLR